MRESLKAKRARTKKILTLLKRLCPNAHTVLTYHSEFQLLVAVMLSARAMDASVNQVTPILFAKYPTIDALAKANFVELANMLKPVGLPGLKARALIETAQMIRDEFGGRVPQTVEELTRLRGVGRKTALVVLGEGFGINEGIAVDTHVNRLSNRLGLTSHADPVKVEKDLLQVVPREDWNALNHLFIHHGRAICVARHPKCDQCVLNKLCPSARLFLLDRS